MKEMAKAFIGGTIFTIILVIVIPIITTAFIQPFIEDGAHQINLVVVSSSVISAVVMLLVTILFSLLFGGGAILRNYGVVGVLGMIFAYWLLGNIYGAVIPVLTLIAVCIAKYLWNSHLKKKILPKKKKKDKKKKKE